MDYPKIIAKEMTKDGASYRLQWPCGMVLWFDVWPDEYGDVNGDWNKYIFFTDNDEDMKEKAFQEQSNDEVGAYNFHSALCVCEEQYRSDRLEYLRGELRAERISTAELVELQSLAEYIDPGDTELLEAAGVPEHEQD